MLINISRFFIDNTNLKLCWQHYLLLQLFQYSRLANVIFRHAFAAQNRLPFYVMFNTVFHPSLI
uniref:Uncharacterized protein n=1 Tax=Podoviridae sp. ctnCN2 TaxID=2825274 RepID=A0A8S5PLB5_9CAUD|nr:MAG TPA: hypothetical protein [Podoviridae sp. ctnCN2]